MTTFKTKVATAANNLPRKPSPSDKVDAINCLIDELNPALDSDGIKPVIFKALATLYSQHLPNTPAKPKTGFDWCTKAIAKNDSRQYLQSASVLDGFIRCTDGHRLHLAPTALDNGHYDASGTRLNTDGFGVFPSVDRVIPTHHGKERIVFNPIDLKTGFIVKAGKIDVMELREAKKLNDDDKGCQVALKYIKDAMSNPSPIETASYGKGWLDSVYITYKDGTSAVLMPIRL